MKKELIFKPIFFVFVSLAFFVMVQCYTTIRHPKTYSYSDSTETYNHQEITCLDNCSSCHESNVSINNPYHTLHEDPANQYDYTWQYFYALPWWTDPNYYENSQGQVENKLPATGKRDFDRREVSPSPSIAAPGTATPSLSKPATEGPAPVETPPPPKRNERREVGTKESSKVERPAPPVPQEKKQDGKAAKNEKK